MSEGRIVLVDRVQTIIVLLGIFGMLTVSRSLKIPSTMSDDRSKYTHHRWDRTRYTGCRWYLRDSYDQNVFFGSSKHGRLPSLGSGLCFASLALVASLASLGFGSAYTLAWCASTCLMDSGSSQLGFWVIEISKVWAGLWPVWPIT